MVAVLVECINHETNILIHNIIADKGAILNSQ